MKVMIACGGTAGHINPALAIADEIRSREPESEILFVGAGRDLENRLIPRAGFDIVNIKMSGLYRKATPANLVMNAKTLKNLFFASREAGKHIASFHPDAVIGTGGYICYPLLKKAAEAGVVTYIHESNAEPGLTTKLLSAKVDVVFTAFPGLERLYKKPERVLYTGTPVLSDFRKAASGKNSAGAGPRPLLLSFWVSLGAERMNEVMVEFIKLNIKEERFDHIHAVGKKGGISKMLERVNQPEQLTGLPKGIQVREYIDDMPSVMAQADLVLCRAGGSTLAELTVMSKPAVLVPSPYVTNDQQGKNAAQYQKYGGAIVIDEKDCSGESLYNTVASILKDKDKRKRMSDSLAALSISSAESRIVDVMIKKHKKTD